MLKRHYQFESLEHMLASRLRAGGETQPVRCVVFGGTGAVGGAAVLEIARLIMLTEKYDRQWRAEIYATGMSDKEIVQFAQRLWRYAEGNLRAQVIRPRRRYRLGERVDIILRHFRIAPPDDLRERVLHRQQSEGENFSFEGTLESLLTSVQCPFLRFVEDLELGLLDAVLVAVPLPSVAAYALQQIDELAQEFGADHQVATRLKSTFLAVFVKGLAIIRQKLSRRVVIAHTTAIGGMYRVDGESLEIRLGFAHSAQDSFLAHKKYFADRLTELYLDQGLEVLVTAAAIGIDSVEFDRSLPIARGVEATLRTALSKNAASFVSADDLQTKKILLYPARVIDLEATEPPVPLAFGVGKELRVAASLRSGENGYFSVANAVALYHVMKVATSEELAAVVARHIIFGEERRRKWFHDGLCYYTETENAHFAHQVLQSDDRLLRAHHGAFALQAFQDLGSSTHQGRLHELGIICSLLRVLSLGAHMESFDGERLKEAFASWEQFFYDNTSPGYFEDFLQLSTEHLSVTLGRMCEVRSKFDAADLVGFPLRTDAKREGVKEKFFARLATVIRRYLNGVASMGTPIIYRSPSLHRDRVLVGPYIAPLDAAAVDTHCLHGEWSRAAKELGLSPDVVRNWSIANNGFVDFRPHAIATTARSLTDSARTKVMTTTNSKDLVEWLGRIPVGSYFTTCGLLALQHRLSALHREVSNRKVDLGTRESWKNLFFCDRNGKYLMSPGLIEAMRMYTEGLGKVTGTELLWPGWGY